MALRRALRLVLAAATLEACATPIPEQHWRRARTAHFEIASSAAEPVTREVALALEQFRAALLYLLELRDVTPSRPTLIYLFGDSATYARYRPRADVSGFMLPRPWAN